MNCMNMLSLIVLSSISIFNQLYYFGKSNHFPCAYTIMHLSYVMQMEEGLMGDMVVAGPQRA